MTVIIVSCGAKKQDHMVEAGKMYTGTYHRALLAYALSVAPARQVFILSSKYGLLPLNKQISPYERHMSDPDAITVGQVREQAKMLGIERQKCIALGGKPYVAVCRAVFPEIETPLSGIGGMGSQIRWCKEHTR